jgi:hypothetical protein
MESSRYNIDLLRSVVRITVCFMGKTRKRTKSILRLKVRGPHIKPGRIPIPELLTLCAQAQSAVNRQAEVIRGRRGLRSGPIANLVKAECTLELFAIGKGSAMMSFAGPGPPPSAGQGDLDLDPERLGEAAVRTLVMSIREIRRNNGHADMDAGVRRSLQEMGTLLSNGIQSIEWSVPGIGGRRRRVTAVFDETIRKRIDETTLSASARPIEIDGRLEMADFKVGDLKCIVHAPDGRRIPCSFDTTQEEKVYKALRHVARVTGIATLDPKTNRIDTIALSDVVALDPFLSTGFDFFSPLTLDQLTKAQGVDPTLDLRQTPKDVWPEDEDVDAFLASIDQN